MRVCFVAPHASSLLDPGSPGVSGGAETQMVLLATGLAKRDGYECSLVVEGSGVGGLFEGLAVSRYTSRSEGVPGVTLVTNQMRLLRALRHERADVYVQSPAGFVTATVAAFCRLSRSTFIYRLASDGDLDGSLVASRRQRSAFLWALARADAFIARNRFQRDELKRRFGKDSVVIPNAFPVPDTEPTTPKEFVLWVASSQNLKQPWLFLDLARAFPHERFCMIMPSNDVSLFERMSAEAAELPNLEFSSGVPFAQIQTYFDRAKLFVNTSTVEGFPNTFVQAAMGATPVLSLTVNPDDVLTENGFGRCAEGDFERLSADVADLLGDEGLRTSMGHAGFEYAKHTHDIAAVLDRFESLLGEAGRR